MNHKKSRLPILAILVAIVAVILSSCSTSYPTATPMRTTATKEIMKDHYISPYRPYNPIIAKGFKSGQLAGDPSTIKINPITGKPDKSTLKIFKIP